MPATAQMTNPGARASSHGAFPVWFDAATQRQLERFSLAWRRGGGHAGEFRSVRRGGQLEFVEHRPYAIGDDLKFLDWNVFGRLDALHVKTFAREMNYTLTVLVDASASMSFPVVDGAPHRATTRWLRRPVETSRPPQTKFEAALFVGAAVSYLALAGGHKGGGGNRVRFAIADGADSRPRFFDERSGKAGFLALMRDLARPGHDAPRGGRFAPVLDRLASLPRLRGPVLVVTDGYDAAAQHHALQRLAAIPDVSVIVVQVLSTAEFSPALDGNANLIDAESGQEVGVVDAGVVSSLYREAFGQFVDSWKEACSRHSIHHVVTDAGSALLESLLVGFHRAGVVV